jgi:hypothetical protein
MDRPDKLCATCSTIPFDPEELCDSGLSVTLKPGSEVRESLSCPFCRLVSYVLAECEKHYTNRDFDNEKLVLNWQRNLGPGQSFHLEGGSLGCNIAFISGSNSSEFRKLEPLRLISKPHIEIERVRHWLSTCINTHSACAPPPGNVELKAFRVVDVLDGCLVETTILSRYFALSYVWGGVPTFRLTTLNKRSLMQKGVLLKIWDSLPPTIKDAIRLVKKLNERYIWIDTMCLIQTDPEDLRDGIESMDMIYERATMTIVASCCNNANHGLPGVKDSSRLVIQKVEEVKPGVKLAVHCDLDHLLRQSTYSTRAWT